MGNASAQQRSTKLDLISALSESDYSRIDAMIQPMIAISPPQAGHHGHSWVGSLDLSTLTGEAHHILRKACCTSDASDKDKQRAAAALRTFFEARNIFSPDGASDLKKTVLMWLTQEGWAE